MHSTVLDFVVREIVPEMIEGKRVLEVGSYDVNGSVRPMIVAMAPAQYVGTDAREGPGVDRVLKAEELVPAFGRNGFDVVLCLEMLEHAEDWRGAVNAMKEVLRPGGRIVLTARSLGFPLHDFPSDYWRFETLDFGLIFSDFKTIAVEQDTLVAGAFLHAVKPELWLPEDLTDIHVHKMAGP